MNLPTLRPPASDRASEPLEHFVYRVLLDAYLEGATSYWHRRADQLEAARPRAQGFVPAHITRAEQRHQWDRLTAAAEACRHRAAFLDASTHELDQALTDLSGAA